MIGDGFETLADSTLKKQTKDELISIIRMMENNLRGQAEMNENQYKILMQWNDELNFYRGKDLIERNAVIEAIAGQRKAGGWRTQLSAVLDKTLAEVKKLPRATPKVAMIIRGKVDKETLEEIRKNGIIEVVNEKSENDSK